MEEVSIYKAVISVINVCVIASIPYWIVYHGKRIGKQVHSSDDWYRQIIYTLAYLVALTCESAALWSRLIVYYKTNIEMPDLVFVINIFDRWGHQILYLILFVITWEGTNKRVPQSVKNIIG